MGGPKYYKVFLIGSNILLLFVGLTIFILGIKMQWALSVLQFINIPIVMKAVEAVIATGFFVSLSGVTGLCGACYENKWMLLAYLVSLGIIVIMEFSVGVALMIVKKTILAAMETPECNNVCLASIDSIILEYALPSAGLMMTVIFVEALMIYSTIRMYFYVRDTPKGTVTGPTTAAQNNVGISAFHYVMTPNPVHSSSYELSPQLLQRSHACQISRQAYPSLAVEDSPPEYDTLFLQPLSCQDRTTSTWVDSGLESSLDAAENADSKESDDVFREV